MGGITAALQAIARPVKNYLALLFASAATAPKQLLEQL